MSPDFLSVHETTPVGRRSSWRGEATVAPEALTTVFTADAEGRLAGSVLIVRLLGVPRDVPLCEVAGPDPRRLRTDTDLPELARIMTDFNLTVCPVVDEDQRMLGVVTVDDVLEMILPSEWRRRAEVLGDD